MVSALASRSSGQVWVLAGDIVCCVLELGKTLTPVTVIVPLSTQVYKWLSAGGNPAMD